MKAIKEYAPPPMLYALNNFLLFNPHKNLSQGPSLEHSSIRPAGPHAHSLICFTHLTLFFKA